MTKALFTPCSLLDRLARQTSIAVLALALSVPIAGAETPSSALAQASRAVAVVQSADDQARFLGSAFLWGADGGIVVTNAHVTGEARRVRLVWPDGFQEIAEVIAADATRDVAVIAVNADTHQRSGLVASPAAPGLGDEIWAIGAPLGIAGTVTSGHVSALDRQVDPAAPLGFVQHDAAVNPGSSGGPLVDGDGRLVGMNSRIADGSRLFVGVAYAISAADLDRIVTGLIDQTLSPMPRLGLRLRAVDRQIAAALGMDRAQGLLIDSVEPGAAADQLGLISGDVVITLGAHDLTQPGDLSIAIEAAGQSAGIVALTLFRGVERIDLPFDIGLVQTEAPTLRAVSGSPERIASYDLAGLGMDLDVTGRVTGLTDTSPAALAGIATGDRILRLNGVDGDQIDLTGLRVTAPLLVLVQSTGGTTRHVLIDPWTEHPGIRPLGGANALDPAVIVF